jgi:hypothetical protein
MPSCAFSVHPPTFGSKKASAWPSHWSKAYAVEILRQALAHSALMLAAFTTDA